MNRVYRVIWSKAKQSFAVVSECSRAQGKGGVSDDRRARAAVSGIRQGAVVAAMVLMFSGQALAGLGYDVGNAEATSVDSIAIGSNTIFPANKAKATGGRSTAIGDKAKATGPRSLAVGEGTKATEDQAVAIGSKNTRALGDQSIAIGGDTNALGGSSIAIGGDDIDSVANTTGIAWNNYGVSNEDFNNSAIAIKYKQKTGQYLVDNTNSATRFVKTTGKGDGTVAIGAQSYAGGALAAAVGTGSKAGGFAATAFGIGAKATKDNSIALGAGSITSLANASQRNADGSLKFEAIKIVEPDGTIRSLTADQARAEDEKYYSAIHVPNAKVPKLDADGNPIPGEFIEYKGFAGGTEHMEPGDFVSVGSRNYERQIKHVAAGQVSPESTDAINGSQLFTITEGLQDQIKKGTKTYFHFNDPNMTQGDGNAATNLGGATEKAGAEGNYSITAGVGARAKGTDSISIGKGSGYNVSSVSEGNIAVGKEAGRIIRSKNSLALGANAGSYMNNASESISLGSRAGNRVDGERNIALGINAGNNLVGQRNIAAGDSAGSNIFGGSNISLGWQAGTNFGQGTLTDSSDPDRPPSGVFTEAVDNNISIGKQANNFTGGSDRLKTSNNIAIGLESKASGTEVAGVGSGQSIAIGTKAHADLFNSTALGSDTQATKAGSVALGSGSVADRAALSAGTATSNMASAAADNVYALDTAKAADKTAVSNTVKGALGAVSVGDADNTRQIINVAAGSDDTDAVNVAQLKAVANVAEAGFTVKGTSTTTAADAVIKPGDTFNIVGAAANTDFTKSDAGKNIYTVVNDDNTVSIGLAKDVTGLDSVVLGDAAGDNVVSLSKADGINAGQKKITNVADGTIGAASKDAVNGSQLFTITEGLQDQIKKSTETYFHVNEDTSTQGTGNADTNLGAIRDKAGAVGSFSITAGLKAKAETSGSVAIGYGAEAKNGISGIAIGREALADSGGDSDSVAIGYKAQATGKQSIAIGSDTIVKGHHTIAIGTQLSAGSDQVISTGNNAVAIGGGRGQGSNAQVEGDDSIAIGTQSHTGDQASGGVAIGKAADSTAQDGIAMGTTAKSSGNNAIAIGRQTQAAADNVTVLGNEATATQKDSVAVGFGADATADSAVAVGKNAQGAGTYSIAVGLDSNATGNGAVTMGSGSGATADYTVALGNDAKANAAGSTALGRKATAEVVDGVALGSSSVADVDKGEVGEDPLGAVTNKANSTWTATNAAVSVGKGTDITRQITSVAAGTADTDAVNVAQLKAAGFKLTTSASAGGEVSGTTEEKVQNGEAVTIDAGKNIKITQDGQKVSVATKDDVEFNSVTIGDATSPDNSTTLTSGTNGLDVGGDKITNVADGTIGAASKDAVNGSQLFDTNNQVAGNTAALGGGASYDPATDTYTKPTYKTVDAAGNPIGGINDADNVGDGLKNINTYVNKGFNVQERGVTKGTVTPTESIDFVDGKLTTAKVTTEADGVTKITFDVDSQGIAEAAQLPVVYTRADGTKVYKQPDGTFNESPDGSGATVAPADIIASMQNADGDTKNPTTLANVNSTIGHNNGEGAINEGDAKTATADLLTQTDGLSTASTVGDLQAVAQAGLDFSGDNSGTTIHKPLGNKLEIIGGADATKLTDNNIGVNADGGKLKVQLAKDITGLDSVVLGDAAGDTVVSLSKDDGINAGQKKITNVADGDISAASKDAVNGSQLFATNQQVKGNTTALGGGASYDPATDTYTKPTYKTVDAAGNPIAGISDADNVGDGLKNINTYVNKGFNVKERGTTKGTVTPTESIDFVDGKLTTAKVTTEADGVTKITFDVDSQGIAEKAQLPVVYTRADGTKVYKVGDNFYDNAAGTGTPVPKGDIIASMQNADGTTATPTTLANVKAGIDDTDAVNVSQLKGTVNALGGGAAVKPDGTVKAPTYTLTDGNPSTGGTTNYNNVGDALTGLNTAVNQPLTFTGNKNNDTGADGSQQKLGSTLKIHGGLSETALSSNRNIKTVVTDNDIDIQIAEAPVFEGQVAAKGLDVRGEKIVNLQKGTDDADAVNVKQLKEYTANLDQIQATLVKQNSPFTYIGEDAGGNPLILERSVENGAVVYKHNGVVVPDPKNLRISAIDPETGGIAVPTQVTNVKAGTEDTDAVNVTQLKDTVDALGGGAAVNPDGTIEAPTYTLTDGNPSTGGTTAYDNVGDALTGLNTAVNQPITFKADTNSDTDNDGSQQQLGSEFSILSGDLTDTDFVGTNLATEVKDGRVLVGMSRTPEFESIKIKDGANETTLTTTVDGLDVGGDKVTNMADGDISPTSKDAINGSQLFATNQQVAGNTTALGGGASYDPATDTYTKPTYKTVDAAGNPIAGISDADNVGDGLKNLNSYVNKGFDVRERGTTKGTVTPTESIDFVDGKLTTAKVTTEENGVTKITFDVDSQSIAEAAQLPVVYTKADGTKVYKVGDNFYDNAAGTGTPIPKGDVIASMQNADGDTKNPTTLANVNSTIGHNNGEGAINEGDAKTAAADLLTQTDGLSTAATVGDLQAVAQAGLDFAGDDSATTTIHKPLGTRLEIIGGADKTSLTDNNIGVNATADGKLKVQLAKDITGLDSVVLGDAAGDDVVSLSKDDGINAGQKKITNVADGTIGAASKDAVNGSQLFDTNNQVAGNTAALGGGASYDPATDTYTKPTYKTVDAAGNPIGGINDADNVGDGLKNINTYVNKGFNVQERGVTKGTVTPTESIDFVDGSLTTAKVTTEANGVTKITFDVDSQGIAEAAQLPVVYTRADGTKVYKQPNGTFNESPDGSGATVAPADIIASMQNADGDTKNPTTLANVNSTIGHNNGEGAINEGDAKTATADLLTQTDGLSTASTVGDLQAVAQAGLDFAGDDSATTTIHKPLGTRLEIIGGADKTKLTENNIGVNSTADGKLKVQLAKDLTGLTSTQFVDSGGTDTIKIDGDTKTIAGLADNLPDTTTTVTTGFNPSQTDLDKVKGNVATVNDVLNSGWNLQGNGTAKDFVNPYDTIDFVDGVGTKVEVATDAAGKKSTIKVNVDAQSLAETAQLPVVYTKADGTKLYKVGDNFYDNAAGTGTPVPKGDIIASMQNADGTTATPSTLANVNSTIGHNNGEGAIDEGDAKTAAADLLTKTDGLSTASTVGDLQAVAQAGLDFAGDDSATTTIHKPLGTRLEIIGGADKTKLTENNIGVNSTADGKLKVQLAKDLTGLDSIVLGAATGDDVVSLTKDNGINAGQKKITNVAAGEISATSKDAINGSQLFAVAAGSKEEVKSSDKSVTVTTTTNAAGANVYDLQVQVDANTMQFVDADPADPSKGKKLAAVTSDITSSPTGVATAVAPDSLVTASDIAGAINSAGWVGTAGAGVDGGIVQGAGDQLVKTGEKVTFDAGKNMKLVQNGKTFTYATRDNVEFTKVTTGNTVMTSSGVTAPTYTTNGNHTVTVSGDTGTVNGLTNTTFDPNNYTSGQAATEDQLASVNETAHAGFNITANGRNPSNAGPGETIDFNNRDGNILIQNKGNSLTFDLNPDLNVHSVTTGNTQINTNGLFIKDGLSLTKDGLFIQDGPKLTREGLFVNGGPSVTRKGIDAANKPITNVARGIRPGDAVNVSQLEDIDEKGAQGTAAALAAASMPQAYTPGTNLMTAGAGTYRGKSAIAIGYSAISDNGKWIFKGSASANEEDAGLSVGVGYQW